MHIFSIMIRASEGMDRMFYWYLTQNLTLYNEKGLRARFSEINDKLWALKGKWKLGEEQWTQEYSRKIDQHAQCPKGEKEHGMYQGLDYS